MEVAGYVCLRSGVCTSSTSHTPHKNDPRPEANQGLYVSVSLPCQLRQQRNLRLLSCEDRCRGPSYCFLVKGTLFFRRQRQSNQPSSGPAGSLNLRALSTWPDSFLGLCSVLVCSLHYCPGPAHLCTVKSPAMGQPIHFLQNSVCVNAVVAI